LFLLFVARVSPVTGLAGFMAFEKLQQEDGELKKATLIMAFNVYFDVNHFALQKNGAVVDLPLCFPNPHTRRYRP
jgi:hypothetical protein